MTSAYFLSQVIVNVGTEFKVAAVCFAFVMEILVSMTKVEESTEKC